MKKIFNLSDNNWWVLKRKIILFEKITFALYLIYAFFKIASDMSYIIIFFRNAILLSCIAIIIELGAIYKEKKAKL